ncbi:hypothetical protein [Persephonella sp.]
MAQPKFRFSKKDRKKQKSIPYQLIRFIALGLHFWKLTKKAH